MAKHKYIETPEIMWQHFISYRDDVKSKPKRKNNFAGKDAIEVYFELEVPLTMEGFENYLFINGIITDVSDYFENKEDRYTDYVPICRAIKRMIRQDQIEGGMTGIYTPSITQRITGLADKQEIKHDVYDVKLNL